MTVGKETSGDLAITSVDLVVASKSVVREVKERDTVVQLVEVPLSADLKNSTPLEDCTDRAKRDLENESFEEVEVTN